jgi:hypothetical protein
VLEAAVAEFLEVTVVQILAADVNRGRVAVGVKVEVANLGPLVHELLEDLPQLVDGASRHEARLFLDAVRRHAVPGVVLGLAVVAGRTGGDVDAVVRV